MSVTGTDVFDVMVNAAQRQRDEEALLKRMGTARRNLVFGGSRSPDMTFWATLALRLKLVSSWSVPTMATDGASIFANPGFTATLPDDEVIGVVAHEVGHLVFSHHARRGHREPELWNIAADLSLNPVILGAGFKLPACRLMPGEGKYAFITPGQSAEPIYSQLQQAGGQNGGGEGEEDGSGQPGPSGAGGKQQGPDDAGGCGTVMDPGDGSEAARTQSEAEWKVAVAQAAQQAKQRGKVSDGLARLIDELLTPKVDWQSVLRDFITKVAKNDYRWTPPNRRFAWRGMYLPSISGEMLGHVVIAIDTSGSIGDKQLAAFSAEINGIVSAYDDAELTILYHDSKVCHVQKWTASEGPLVLEPKGGGGTDHHPVFAWVEEEQVEPTCMVCLTDLESSFPAKAPEYPVLWATIRKGSKGPWGRTVEVC